MAGWGSGSLPRSTPTHTQAPVLEVSRFNRKKRKIGFFIVITSSSMSSCAFYCCVTSLYMLLLLMQLSLQVCYFGHFDNYIALKHYHFLCLCVCFMFIASGCFLKMCQCCPFHSFPNGTYHFLCLMIINI